MLAKTKVKSHITTNYFLWWKSLVQNVAVEAEHATHTRQVIVIKQGSYNFMRWVCNWIKLLQTITNSDSNNNQLI